MPTEADPVGWVTAVLGGALSPWVSELLESLRKEVPALAGLEMAVVDVAETHALLGCAAADGTRKEVVVLREPPALHVYNVVEHGRRWQRSLEYSSDASHCYAEIEGVELGLTPRPHWQMGDAGVAAPPAASLVIVRALTEGQRETFVPGRHLRGLLQNFGADAAQPRLALGGAAILARRLVQCQQVGVEGRRGISHPRAGFRA